MKISIRESTCNGRVRLTVYRPRERTFTLPGSAYETASGFWIVYPPNQPADVVPDKAGAVKVLQDHYATKESAY